MKIGLTIIFVWVAITTNAQCSKFKLEIKASKISNFGLTCPSVPITFINYTSSPIDSIQSYKWNYGDDSIIVGTRSANSALWTQIPEHYYAKDGEYLAEFSVLFTNGFRDTIKIPVVVISKLEVYPLLSVDCGMENFEMTTNLHEKNSLYPSGYAIKWDFVSAYYAGFDRKTNYAKVSNITKAKQAKIAVSIDPNYTTCLNMADTFQFDGSYIKSDIESPRARIDDHLKNQCDATDTVRFSNDSDVGDNPNIQRLWNFGDIYAEQCTTDTEIGINVNRNCNFSRDSLPKHKYTLTDSIFINYYYRKNTEITTYEIKNGQVVLNKLDTSASSAYRKAFEEYILRAYLVTLTNIDTTESCSSVDSIYLYMSPPTAKGIDFDFSQIGPSVPGDHTTVMRLGLDNNKHVCPAPYYEIQLKGSMSYGWKSMEESFLDPRYRFQTTIALSGNATYPSEVYYRFNRTGKFDDIANFKLSRGELDLDIGIRASLGLDASGNLKCPSEEWYDNVLNMEIPNPEFNRKFYGGYCDKLDSLNLIFYNPNQRPTELAIYRGDKILDAYFEYVDAMVLDTAGKGPRSHASYLTRKYRTWPANSSNYEKRFVTSWYDLDYKINWNAVDQDWLLNHAQPKLFQPNIPDSVVLKQMNNSGGFFDTTGFSNNINKALIPFRRNILVVHPADTSLITDAGLGIYNLKLTEPGVGSAGRTTNEDSDLNQDQIRVHMSGNSVPFLLPTSREYAQLSIPFYNYSVIDEVKFHYSFYLMQYSINKENLTFSDTISFGANAYYPDYNALYDLDNKRNNSMRNYGGEPDNYPINLTVGGSSVTFKENNALQLIDPAKNWYSKHVSGSQLEKIYVDWDDKDGKDSLIDPDHWDSSKKVAVFQHVPDHGGDFRGKIVTTNNLGCKSERYFYYRVKELPKDSLLRQFEMKWTVGGKCKQLLNVHDSSTIIKINECGQNQSSTDAINNITYYWGDGDSTIGRPDTSFTHAYGPGKYDLEIVYTSNGGHVYRFVEHFELDSFETKVDFDWHINDSELTYVGQPIADSISLTWNFGDGKSGTSRTGKHTYASNGMYALCLTLEDTASGCSVTECDSVEIGGCNAFFEAVEDTFSSYSIWIIDQSKGNTLDYVWDFGDGDTSHLQKPSHAYNQFGKYNLCLQVSNTHCRSIYCDSIGMDASGKMLKQENFVVKVYDKAKLNAFNLTQGEQVQIYPNPTDGKVTIKTSGQAPIIIQLLDLKGRVLSSTTANGQSTLDLSHLVSGLYFIDISGNGIHTVQRVILR